MTFKSEKEEIKTKPKIRKDFTIDELKELDKEIDPYRVEYLCKFRNVKKRGFGLEEEKKFLREKGLYPITQENHYQYTEWQNKYNALQNYLGKKAYAQKMEAIEYENKIDYGNIVKKMPPVPKQEEITPPLEIYN